jgi:hypothetical protein
MNLVVVAVFLHFGTDNHAADDTNSTAQTRHVLRQTGLCDPTSTGSCVCSVDDATRERATIISLMMTLPHGGSHADRSVVLNVRQTCGLLHLTGLTSIFIDLVYSTSSTACQLQTYTSIRG